MTDSPVARIAHKDPKLPPPMNLPEGPEWVETLGTFGAHMAETLVLAVRTLYPHDRLPERIYRRTVHAIDRLATRLPAMAQIFAEFLDEADAAMPLPFRDLSEGYRVAVLKGMEGSRAFLLVQRSAVRFLYDDVEVWEAFGYEGASVHLGGYVRRGFDDLDWLPPVPAGV
jgi:hypothetical protein